jgi:hypothetical protein
MLFYEGFTIKVSLVFQNLPKTSVIAIVATVALAF